MQEEISFLKNVGMGGMRPLDRLQIWSPNPQEWAFNYENWNCPYFRIESKSIELGVSNQCRLSLC